MKDDEQKMEQELIHQRQQIRALLDEGEFKVPSMTASIMAKVRQGGATEDVTLPVTPLPRQLIAENETQRPKQKRRRALYNAFALVSVAALLILAFGLLRFVVPRSSTSSSNTTGQNGDASTGNSATAQSTHSAVALTWSSIVFTYTLQGTTTIANYNPVTKRSVVLASSPYADTIVNGVSHNGLQVLYSVYDGAKTFYYVYPQMTSNPLYTVSGRSKSAVWSTDDQHILVSSESGVVSINVTTQEVISLLPSLHSVTLLSYRDNTFLYYIADITHQAFATTGTLYRVQPSLNDTPQQVSPGTNGTNFWLSPDGTKVYYNVTDQQYSTLYAVNSDGTNPTTFRPNGGSIVGYAEDNSPLTLLNINNRFTIVQLALNSTAQITRVADVAPGANSVANSAVAVSPYGRALIASGTYKNNGNLVEHRYWYVNLATGTSSEFTLAEGANNVQAIGWDKIPVA